MGVIRRKEVTTVGADGRESTKVTEIEFSHKHDDEPFFQTYINYIGWMYDIHGGASQAVLTYFMENAEFNTGLVRFTAIDRKQLMAKLGLSRAGLYKAIKCLEQVGAITPVEYEGTSGGQYMINPEMFWKGDKSMRSDLIVTFRRIIQDPIDNEGFPVKDVDDIKKL